MYAIDRLSRGIDLLHKVNMNWLAYPTFLFVPENSGGRKYCKYSYVGNYGLAVTVSSKEWWKVNTLLLDQRLLLEIEEVDHLLSLFGHLRLLS